MNVGQKIKERRNELGFNADYLAAQIGVSRSTIFRYEKGAIEKLPTEHLEKLAIALQTTPGYLMGWSEKPQDTLDSIYQQLDSKRQNEVVDFAKYKLNEQKRSENIFTLAAHSDDKDKVATDEDVERINSVLDELDKKYDKK